MIDVLEWPINVSCVGEQLLKARCVDSEAGEILDKMETCLNTLSNAMEDIVAAAEMLGAAHQVLYGPS